MLIAPGHGNGKCLGSGGLWSNVKLKIPTKCSGLLVDKLQLDKREAMTHKI